MKNNYTKSNKNLAETTRLSHILFNRNIFNLVTISEINGYNSNNVGFLLIYIPSAYTNTNNLLYDFVFC